jgi:hypothetical protein
MTTDWPTVCVMLGDYAFGWALWFPRELAVLLVGLEVAVCLLLLRYWTVPVEFERLLKADEGRLRDLIRSAKTSGDKERLQRHRHVRNLVRSQRARMELPVVLGMILVLSVVWCWGQARLDYLPVRTGDRVEFVVQTPAAMVGKLAHVVPAIGMSSEAGWIRVVESDVSSGQVRGTATWTLQLPANDRQSSILVQLGDESLEHAVWMDGRHYLPPLQTHRGLILSDLQLSPFRPFGAVQARVVPGVSGWSLLFMLGTGIWYWMLNRLVLIGRGMPVRQASG